MLVLIQKFLKELDGRDKTIKIIQYAFKILLYYKLVNPKRWAAMVSQFSMTRKILRLGLFVGPARALLFEPALPLWQKSVMLNEFSNMVGDDLFCLYKLGVVSPSVGKRAEVIAIYCWFLGILNDLAENYKTLHGLRTKEKPDQEKVFNTQISIVKLTMDCIFCACDIWQPSFAAGVQAWAGFFSGSLSGYKLWRKIASAS
ncbi:peroxisomal biogenesis factor 11 [Dichotomocladium elegans]|nr:peroxisomal biogenesis factor 11 [Dichotomocladium elegans]